MPYKDKEKNKEYDKKYREENKEKIKEYRESNKEKAKEYRENNKDKIKEYHKNIKTINGEIVNLNKIENLEEHLKILEEMEENV